MTRTFELAARGAGPARARRSDLVLAQRHAGPRSGPEHCGLFELNGSAKPAWGAFTALTGGLLSASADQIRAGLDIGPTATLAVGGGTAFPLVGWCHHPAGRTLSLEVAVAGARRTLGRTTRCRVARSGSVSATMVRTRTGAASSGWRSSPGSSPPGRHEISLRAHIWGHRHARGRRRLNRPDGVAARPELAGSRVPLGCHRPSGGRLHGQLRPAARAAPTSARLAPGADAPQLGLRDQQRPGRRRSSRQRLKEEVAGDERFALVRSERVGFYRNFEVPSAWRRTAIWSRSAIRTIAGAPTSSSD